MRVLPRARHHRAPRRTRRVPDDPGGECRARHVRPGAGRPRPLEPLGCVVHSSDVLARAPARYARPRSIVILGAGPAGLLFVQYLRQVLGFDGVLLVSEPNARKRALAERFGAETIDAKTDAEVVEVVAEKTHGRRAELLIEATGSGPAFATIAGLIRKQATVLMYGHGHAGVDLSVLN